VIEQLVCRRALRQTAHTVLKTRNVPSQTSEWKYAKNAGNARYIIRERILPQALNMDGSVNWFYSVRCSQPTCLAVFVVKYTLEN
jgi:hypothetical protein